MEEKYREMFDEVRASARLREEVRNMTKLEQKMPRRRRLPKAWLIAAALLLVLAGTAAAMVAAPGTLRGWFAQEWEETTGNTMDESQLALIDQLTQPVGVSDTQNGVTVTVDSVTVGNSTIWLLLKVSGEYPEKENFYYNFDGNDLTLDPDPDEVGTPGGYSLSYPYSGVTEDGMLTILVQFTIDLAGQSSLLDCPRQVTLVMDDLVETDMTRLDGDTVLVEGNWTLTFPLEPTAEKTVLSLGEIQVPAQKLETREIKTITLWDVEISATDITYVRSKEDQEWMPMECALVLEDGSVVRENNGSSRFRDEAYTEWSSVLFWKFPVDLSQVTAVRFGDTEISLK